MNYVIKNAELRWAKLVHPVSPFGTDQWECQVFTSDTEQAKEWKNNHLKPKKIDGGFAVNLSRTTTYGKSGKEKQPPVVVGRDLQPIDGNIVGNGSIGNVQVEQYDWSFNGKSGTKSELKAIQVVELKEYNKTNDIAFEPMDVVGALDESNGLF